MILPNQDFALNCVLKPICETTVKLITFEKMTKTIFKIYAGVALLLGSASVKAQTLDEAIKHLDAERYEAASKAFQAISTSNPTPQSLFYKGYGILKSPEGLTAESLKNAQAAFEAGNLADKKGDPINQIGLGMVKLASNDIAGAKAIFEQVKKDTKLKNTDALYRIAEAYTMFPKANDAAEAIMNIDLALEKSKAKDNPEYYMVKSDAFMLKNEGGDAMNALLNAERLGKKLGKVYEKMAKVWLQGRNYKEANDVIMKGIAADPTHAPIYKYESSLMQSLNKYKEAAAAAKRYLDNSDGDCKAKLRYSKLAFVVKDFESVKKTIEEIKSCNSDPYVYRMAGIINFEENNPVVAIENLDKFIKNVPSDENPAIDYGYKGRSYFKMPGEGADRIMYDSLAVLNIEKAISLGDTSFNYYDNFAGEFMKRKNYDKAAFFAEKALNTKKKPDATDFAKVGTYYSAARNWIKADDYVDKALGLYKGAWVDGYALSARLKTYKGDSTYKANFMAAPLYTEYLEKLGAGKTDPKNKRNVIEALKYLAGREFQVSKDLPKAISYLEELLQIDPANEEVKKQLEFIKSSQTSGASPGK